MTTVAVKPVSTSTPRRTPRRTEALLVAAVVLLSGLVHAWNMFDYPYIENDEATYLSRGWSFVTEGQLDVNTYRYDHAPVGWMIIGGWLGLTGGGDMFGGMVEAGRVLMLLIHLANTVLVYVIAKRMSGGRMSAGLIAALVFALTPLGIYFHRRVLLDNLMTVLVLLAILLLLRRPLTLGATVGSGVAFGLAVLAKLNAAFFGVGFLILLWVGSVGAQRKHAFLNWLASAGGTVLLFFVYALLNNEFFPAPLDDEGQPTHVSLIDTFELQLGRGDFAWPWDPASSFRMAFDSWLVKDQVTLLLGAAAIVGLTLFLVARRFRDAHILALLAFVVGYVAFLARGGIVIDLYIAPLLPFLAIGVGMLGARLTGLLRPGALRSATAAAMLVTIGGAYVVWGTSAHLEVDETRNQDAAVTWIEQRVEPGSIIVGDNYAYPELAIEGPYPDTMYFFNAEYDPELRDVYGDDWRNVDYLVLTHEVVEQISQGTVPRMNDILEHSTLVASYTDGTSSFIDLDKRISTNGDWAQVWQVKSRNQIVLQDAWERFRDDWVVSYGQVLELQPGSTTSLDQALALEQALAQDDEVLFDGIWQWTSDHLRHRDGDRLTSWHWAVDDLGRGELGSSDTVCAADQRLMGLLLDAATAWDDESLRREAYSIAVDWWEQCTFTYDGMTLVDSSADGSIDDRLVNPSYFDPVLYRRLADEMPVFAWDELIDDGYALLARLVDERGTVPNWVVYTESGELASAVSLTGDAADTFGEDALRLVPTLLRDELGGEERASAVLDAITPDVIAYADDAPGLGSATTLTMLAQVHDVGVDPIDLYLEHIASELDPETHTWDGTLADFAWLYGWHRFQEDLPASMTVPLI
ncbi:glycosyl hydrolase family 8 [Demequina sp. NBRC 110056]|uniref:glycosyl hydrolase family 8 n=1 Tax=Demequina sp. NBRC 110056 TaxID=1570345 RepID=UPI000A0784C8|nr:glycosyl hydrolase family 8 [Demequina sp. NBRC 110056]